MKYKVILGLFMGISWYLINLLYSTLFIFEYLPWITLWWIGVCSILGSVIIVCIYDLFKGSYISRIFFTLCFLPLLFNSDLSITTILAMVLSSYIYIYMIDISLNHRKRL